jgi:hypothetical protein
MNPGFNCTGQLANCVFGVEWFANNVLNSVPHGDGLVMVWAVITLTMTTIVFYQWKFECTEIPWRDPEAHYHAIHQLPSPHVSA